MFNKNPFYHNTIKKYVIVFGSIFNGIYINKTTADGTTLQTQQVPIAYGPAQKFLTRLEQYEKSPVTVGGLKQPVAVLLPRMSFEMTSFTYDGARRLPKIGKYRSPSTNPAARNYQYTPVPYNINFRLSVLCKNAEDGAKIVEQIVPYFGPEFTNKIILIPEMDIHLPIPLVLKNLNLEDKYDGEYADRRALVWTMDFTMMGYFFGPVYTSKVIKNTNVNLYTPSVIDETTIGNSEVVMNINIRPGLTADGEPTTDANESIPYANINSDDDYGLIESITEYFG